MSFLPNTIAKTQGQAFACPSSTPLFLLTATPTPIPCNPSKTPTKVAPTLTPFPTKPRWLGIGMDGADIYAQPISGTRPASAPLASTPCVQSIYAPSVYPNNYITYASSRIGDPNNYTSYDIFSMDRNGSDQQALTCNKDTTQNFQPAWSPDGTQIAFMSDSAGQGAIAQIYVMRSDGSHLRQLTNDNNYNSEPNWSSDGKYLTYVTGVTKDVRKIYVMNASDGGNARFLYDTPIYFLLGHYVRPMWSPNGKKLVFGKYNGTHDSIYIADINVSDTAAALSNVCEITTGLNGDNGLPSWSPFGNKISFNVLISGTTSTIYVADAICNSNPQPITQNGFEFGPSVWSADGNFIAFTKRVLDGTQLRSQIYVMNSGGQNPTNISNNLASDRWANWWPRTPPGVCLAASIAKSGIISSDCQGTTCTITLKLQSPGVTLEAADMQAVAYSNSAPVSPTGWTGLFIHEAPTLNSRKLGAGTSVIPSMNGNAFAGTGIAWGTMLTASARLAIPANNPNQLWYQIISAPLWEPLGWIMVAMKGDGTNPEIDYTDTVKLGPGQEGNCSTLPSPPTLNFTYDRVAAAEYAMYEGYQNATVQSAGVGRDTSRIAPSIPSISTLAANYPLPPFANFAYPLSLITGVVGHTASAIFISESLWMGGFPMTNDAKALSNYQSNCSVPPITFGNEANYEGWRYCNGSLTNSPEAASVRNSWKSHNILGGYYATPSPIYPNSINNTILSELNPGSDQHGKQINQSTNSSVTFYNNNTTIDINELIVERIINGEGLTSGGTKGVFNPAKWNNFFTTSNSDGGMVDLANNIITGDYVFIDIGRFKDPDTKESPDWHGLLVVGWGEAVTCDKTNNISAPIYLLYLDPSNSSSSSNPQLQWIYIDRTSALAQNRINNPVPYVIDHSGDIKSGQRQRPVPRPFYCTWYGDSHSFAHDVKQHVHNWYFYHFPDNLTMKCIPFANSACAPLYDNTQWVWLATDGVPTP